MTTLSGEKDLRVLLSVSREAKSVGGVCVIDPFLKANDDHSGPWVCICIQNDAHQHMYGQWDNKERAVAESYCGCSFTHIVTNRVTYFSQQKEKSRGMRAKFYTEKDREYFKDAEHYHINSERFGIQTESGERVGDAQTWWEYSREGWDKERRIVAPEYRVGSYSASKETFLSAEQMAKFNDEAHKEFASRMMETDMASEYEFYIDPMGRKKRRKRS